jgi:hypothetical protein
VPTDVALGRWIPGEEKVAVDIPFMLTQTMCQNGLILPISCGFFPINLLA